MADAEKRSRPPACIERPAGLKSRNIRWGSDVIAETLRRLQIPYIAVNPGASFRGLHDSIVNYLGNERPQLLLTLHELHAIGIAHGYAKVTGVPMAACLHSNVGLMNGSMGIYNAWCDRSPVLILGATGHVDAARRRPWIEWIHTSADQGELIRNYTKWDDQPASPQSAVESLLRANQIARTMPCGPVYVCFDVAIQEDPAADDINAIDVSRFEAGALPSAGAADVRKAAAMLAGARRPVILMGRGSRQPEDWHQRLRLAEILEAPVVTDLKLPAVFPTRHRLHPVAPAFVPSEPAQQLVGSADVILSLDWVDLAGILKASFKGGVISARVISVSLDRYNHRGWSADYQALAPVDLPILAAPDSVLSPLADSLATMPPGARTNASPLADSKRSAITGRGGTGTPGLDLEILAAQLAHQGERRSLSILRLPLGWPGSTCDFNDPLSYLGYDGGGGIGSGPGMAVGSALALMGSGRIPVAILGDGDYLMGVTALWTAAHYRIPVLFLIADNRSFFNDELHQHRVALARGRPVNNRWIGQRIDDPQPDLAALARAQGIDAEGPVVDSDALARALRHGLTAVDSGKPYLIDVVIRRDYGEIQE